MVYYLYSGYRPVARDTKVGRFKNLKDKFLYRLQVRSNVGAGPEGVVGGGGHNISEHIGLPPSYSDFCAFRSFMTFHDSYTLSQSRLGAGHGAHFLEGLGGTGPPFEGLGQVPSAPPGPRLQWR